MKLITRPPSGNWFNVVIVCFSVFGVGTILLNGITIERAGALIGFFGVLLIAISDILRSMPIGFTVFLRIIAVICLFTAFVLVIFVLATLLSV